MRARTRGSASKRRFLVKRLIIFNLEHWTTDRQNSCKRISIRRRVFRTSFELEKKYINGTRERFVYVYTIDLSTARSRKRIEKQTKTTPRSSRTASRTEWGKGRRVAHKKSSTSLTPEFNPFECPYDVCGSGAYETCVLFDSFQELWLRRPRRKKQPCQFDSFSPKTSAESFVRFVLFEH